MRLLSISFETAFFMSVFRYLITLHITWMINSVSHIGSWKPYDRNIEPSDSKFFGTLTFGEGLCGKKIWF
jgi:stearoyl-CoA desaturase (delta-9 desaturase)